ncbi:MAG: type IV secretion system protein B4 [Sneathiella sp.]
MLASIATTTLLSLAGAALVIPASRRLLLGDVEQDWLAGELEFDRIIEDGMTVRLKNGHFFRAFTLKGLPYETKPLQQQEALLEGRADLIHQIGQTGSTFRLFGIKRQEDVSFEANWPSPALKEIGEAEQATYKSGYDVYWYLILEAKDPISLEKASSKAQTILADYDIAPVSSPDKASEACSLTGLISYLTTGELRFDLPAISKAISGNVPASDLQFKADGTIETQAPTKKLSKALAVSSWPELLQGMILTEIIALNGDIEVCQIARPLQNERTIAGLLRKSNELSTGIIGNVQHASENNAVAELLSSNAATLFETQFQIIARADTEEELSALVQDISEVLSRRRVVFSVETSAAPVCWFNRMPGRSKLVRPLRLLDRNIAALWPLQYSPKGMKSSPFGGQPVRLFKTPSGQSYSFQFHASEQPQSPGNYIVFAPTGGGKSTLICHLLGGTAKFAGHRNYLFDSKEGARFMIEAMGGVYQSFEKLSLNPLDTARDNKTSRQQITMIMRAMLGNQYKEDMDDAIAHAIDLAHVAESPNRTFSDIFDCAFPKNSEIYKAFTKWVMDSKGKEGLYSHVFNASHNSLSSYLKESHLVGINMNEALEDPILGAPVVAHISTAIAEAAKVNKGSFSIFVDEAANLLQNKGFRDIVLQMYREYRKLNGVVGLAFQDPAALIKFPDHQGIINNTQTLIFLPNSLVKKEDLEPFNLNEEQISFITGSGHSGAGRQVLIVKRDATTGYDESTILNVDLSYLGDALRFYRAGADANRDLDDLQQTWGSQWHHHL